MRYFKIVDEDNYIVAAGIGEGGEEINVLQYNRIHNLINQKPSEPGVEYKLNQELRWEAIEKERETLSDKEVREIFAREILESIEVSHIKPKADKEGFLLKQIYDPAAHMIIWEYVEDPYYVQQDGTFFNPIQYEDGISVETGKWYTDGENFWEAIQSGVPESFEDRNYFEIIG